MRMYGNPIAIRLTADMEQRLALIQRRFHERNPDAKLTIAAAARIAVVKGLEAMPETTKDSTN